MNDRLKLIKRYQIFNQKVKGLKNTRDLMDSMGMNDTANQLHQAVLNLQEEIKDIEIKLDNLK